MGVTPRRTVGPCDLDEGKRASSDEETIRPFVGLKEKVLNAKARVRRCEDTQKMSVLQMSRAFVRCGRIACGCSILLLLNVAT